MSKITTYLNEHLTGEVIGNSSKLNRVSTDGSILLKHPEVLVNAASTSDIRKVARFCWQLAEKGHVLPITVRGFGTDTTGAAIGSGVIISEEKYMNRVVGIDPKQRLIHVQAGASYHGVNMSLSTHKGLMLPYESFDGSSGSIGGAIASGAIGTMNGRYGTVGNAVKQLEIVLASGDVLQTGRLSKRELNAKKGLQTFEGEVYRQIDNLIEDNLGIIRHQASRMKHNTAGYHGIVNVKRKDGSFDLTPLFVGSQGSLGIITEVIMQSQFARQELSVVLASFNDMSSAQSAADSAVLAKAVSVEIIDGSLLKEAASQGKSRPYMPPESFSGALMVAFYDDFSAAIRNRMVKKLSQQIKKLPGLVYYATEKYTLSDLADLRAVISVASQPMESNTVVPGIFHGIWVANEQFDNLLVQFKKMEAEFNIKLPFYADYTSGIVNAMQMIDVSKVSDRQKLLKILAELAESVSQFGGSLSGAGGDGRIKAAVAQKAVSIESAQLSEKIKNIFDPYNILNPGVKQITPIKDLAAQFNDWCRSVGKS